MGHTQFDGASRDQAAWMRKEGRHQTSLTQKQIWAIRFHLDRERRIRDRALFDLAIDSKLRGCDLVKIRIRDLVAGPEIRTRAVVVAAEDWAAGSSSKSRATYAQASWLGSNGVAGQWRTMHYRAV